MSGSPHSNMMLRSQCRSTPDLVQPYCNCQPSWLRSLLVVSLLSIIILPASNYFMYRQYILPKLDEAMSIHQNGLHDNWITHTKQIVKREISLYDADKTNLADYALESSGAVIVTTRCTKSYLEKNIQYSIDGLLPIFYTSNSPRVVIQPTINPGDCWSFAGSEGSLVVQLSRTIVPTSFSYEHIPKDLSPDLHIESAPRHFRVKSLKDANDKEGLLLGEYDYDKEGEPLQQFKVQNPNPIPTRFIELIIQSNHGELQYTCLYRFRVHGIKY